MQPLSLLPLILRAEAQDPTHAYPGTRSVSCPTHIVTYSEGPSLLPSPLHGEHHIPLAPPCSSRWLEPSQAWHGGSSQQEALKNVTGPEIAN